MLFILILLALYCTTCATVKSRNRAACTLVKTTVYCYGGGALTDLPGSHFIGDDHFYMDLATTSFKANGPVDQWMLGVSGLERRWGHTMTTLANDTGYVMVMGSSDSGDGKSVLRDTTVMYNVSQNRWTTLSPLPDTFASSSVLGANNTIWVYGGLIALDNKTQILDGFYNDKVNVTNVTLPNTLYGLDTKASLLLRTWQWSHIPLPTQYDVRADHGAGLVGTKMFIVGGMTLGPGTRVYSPMDQIMVFDTLDRQWRQVTTQGTTPSQRRAFSITYLPHKSQFVIYGGIFDSGSRNKREALTDLCYTLTVSNMTWTKVGDVQSTPGNNALLGAGQIYGHSSVLYNTDLLIMFGVDETGQYRADVNILDTLTWQWKPSHDISSSTWTTAAIAGLVTGLLCGILFIVGGLYYRKRRGSDENYHPNLFPATKRANDPFVIDSSDDPRLRVESGRPIYQEEARQAKEDRHISVIGNTTLLGSDLDEKRDGISPLAHRHLSQESTFTSFSGTTTKPDLPEHASPVERIKPEGDH